MEDKVLSGQESLDLIAKMIRNTQNRFERHSGMPFIIWGYATLAVSIAVWFLLTRTLNPQWNLLWFAIIPIGITGMLATRRKKEKHVSTYVDKVVTYIWMVIGACCIIGSILAMFGPLDQIIFFEALLVNIGAALTGLSIRLKYVATFGIVGILLSFGLLFFSHSVDQIWLFCAVICTTMIIPGHIMNAQGRKYHLQNK